MRTALVHELLIHEFNRRVIDESIPRIIKCMEMLSEKQVWKEPGKDLPTIGNLVLHVCGNGRQWVCSGLGNQPDTRHRYEEFAADKTQNKAELLALLQSTGQDMLSALAEIGAGDLVMYQNVQVFEETGISILVHVIEHFSYHTGQIALMTRMFTGKHTGFYQGVDL